MIGLRAAPREVRAQWFAEFEVGSGTFESSASRWAKCIRVEGGEGSFWSGLTRADLLAESSMGTGAPVIGPAFGR